MTTAFNNTAEKRTRVIIGFKEEPDPGILKKSGGNVNRVFNIVPAVAGSVPSKEIDCLKRNGKVAYVEPDRKLKILDGETLPWGQDRIDANNIWNLEDDDAYNGSGPKVAILDTGIDTDHPDLKNNYEGGYDFVNDDKDPMDDHGHGTHCAGIVAAANNEIGVIGSNPDASLYGVKVLDSGGSGYISDIVAGLEWSVNNGMNVVSMSFGSDSDSTTLRDACRNAYDSGVLLVAAAGNDGNPGGNNDCVDYPARYDSVIAVAATEQDDSRATFSSTGPDVELAAPGVDIYSTYWNDTYATLSGTSMACPHVTGTAALVMAKYSEMSNVKIRNLLQDTAEDLGPNGRDIRYGYGLVDAEKAVSGTTDSSPMVAWQNPTDGQEVSDTVSIQIDASDEEDSDDSLTVEWNIDGGTWNTTTYNSDTGYYEDSWDTTSVSEGEHTLKARAEDSAGNTGTSSITVTVNNDTSGETSKEMYVWDISWKEAGPHLKSTVTIRYDSDGDGVAESSDDPVSDATINYTLSLDSDGDGSYDDDSRNYTGTTDSKGQVEFMWKQAPSGDYKGEVTGLTHSTYIWDSTLDKDNPDYYTK